MKALAQSKGMMVNDLCPPVSSGMSNTLASAHSAGKSPPSAADGHGIVPDRRWRPDQVCAGDAVQPRRVARGAPEHFVLGAGLKPARRSGQGIAGGRGWLGRQEGGATRGQGRTRIHDVARPRWAREQGHQGGSPPRS